MGNAGVAIVNRHAPHNRRRADSGAETQILCCIIIAGIGAGKPYAFKVNRHIDFFSRISIVAEYPNLIELRIDFLGPYFVEKHISLYLIGIAAVYHKLVLRIEIADSARHLTVGEVADAMSRSRQHCG